MPLNAIRHVRKMRGGAQAHLVEADDRRWYVVKFRNNPQHRRVLVNEALSAELLSYLKISAPETALIHVTREFLQANPECCLQLGARRVEIEAGWQFGSRFPGDPATLAVYDCVLGLADFQPWLDQVVHFPEEVIDRAWKAIPPDWIDGEEDALDALLQHLWERRKRVPALIEACRQLRTNPFVNW